MYFGGGVFLRSRWWLPYSLTPWGGVRMDGARRSAGLKKQSPGGSQSPGLLFSPTSLNAWRTWARWYQRQRNESLRLTTTRVINPARRVRFFCLT